MTGGDGGGCYSVFNKIKAINRNSIESTLIRINTITRQFIQHFHQYADLSLIKWTRVYKKNNLFYIR